MRLNHNLASLNIFQEQSRVLQRQSSAVERISTGQKVNKTKDNPDNLSKSEKLRMHIRGTQMASRNVQDGVSMLQNAQGALESVNDTLVRIRELTVQAGNDTNTFEDRETIQSEINQLMEGLDDIVSNAEFNGVRLIGNDGIENSLTQSNISMPTGANVGDKVEIPSYNLKSSLLIGDLKVTGAGGTNAALEKIDAAMETVLSVTSKYGALENRFESSFKNLNEIGDRMQGAESSLRDADIAEEMMEFAKSNILVEAGNALMAQSNKFPQDVLRILENMRR